MKTSIVCVFAFALLQASFSLFIFVHRVALCVWFQTWVNLLLIAARFLSLGHRRFSRNIKSFMLLSVVKKRDYHWRRNLRWLLIFLLIHFDDCHQLLLLLLQLTGSLLDIVVWLLALVVWRPLVMSYWFWGDGASQRLLLHPFPHWQGLGAILDCHILSHRLNNQQCVQMQTGVRVIVALVQQFYTALFRVGFKFKVPKVAKHKTHEPGSCGDERQHAQSQSASARSTGASRARSTACWPGHREWARPGRTRRVLTRYASVVCRDWPRWYGSGRRQLVRRSLTMKSFTDLPKFQVAIKLPRGQISKIANEKILVKVRRSSSKIFSFLAWAEVRLMLYTQKTYHERLP